MEITTKVETTYTLVLDDDDMAILKRICDLARAQLKMLPAWDSAVGDMIDEIKPAPREVIF